MPLESAAGTDSQNDSRDASLGCFGEDEVLTYTLASRDYRMPEGPLRLDLGSGPTPRPGFVGVDLEPAPAKGDHFGVIGCRLDTGLSWPFADDSVHELYSCHFIEHLPNANGADGKDLLVRFMEEAFRVLIPGGKFTLIWPSPVNEETRELLISIWFDPTHRRAIPMQQLDYFTAIGRKALNVEQYDIRCDWVLSRIGQRKLTPDGRLMDYVAELYKPTHDGSTTASMTP